MKKYLVLCAGFCAVLAMTSCSSSKESAYKKAYEKAKAQEQTQTEEPAQTETAVVTPLTPVTPANQTTVTNVDNATVRSESVTVINGEGLQDYSVVVGS